MRKCSTCGVNVDAMNFSEFRCPSCLETIFVRCLRCKKIKNEYTCPQCKFSGP